MEGQKTPKESRQASVVFMQLGLLFTVCLIAANIFETKQIAVGPINLTGGLLVFPLTHVICRIVCEVWGFQRASLLIWTGFLLNFFFMAAAALVDAIPGAPYYENGEGFHAIFGLAPLIKRLKDYEGADVYDQDISYGIFDIFKKDGTRPTPPLE